MTTSSLVLASNQFGFDLLSRLCSGQPEANVFVSPASLSLALAMTGNGADDATGAAMRRVLRLPDAPWAEINAGMAELWQLLAQSDPRITLNLANALWAEPGFPFASAFRDALTAQYQARIANLDFGDPAAVGVINGWVADQTRQKITDLLTAGDLAGAVLVLVNAIYFKGLWAEPFDPAETRTADFHLMNGTKRPLPFMQRRGDYHYAEYEQWQMVSLPFGDGRLSLVVVLPQPGITLQQLRSSLNVDTWKAWRTRLFLPAPQWERPWQPAQARQGRRPGLLRLPRFSLGYRRSLLPDLTALGLTANQFDRMSAHGEPLLISKVIHETMLEVNEVGAEAAAATAVVMTRSLPPAPFEMLVNRPFFCAIQDNLTGLILFMGAVYAPEA